MKRIRTLNLAQFYRVQFKPLLEWTSSSEEELRHLKAEFFESLGWLIEGVFCGFFDPHEADLVWIGLEELRNKCGKPEVRMVTPVLETAITRLLESHDPFRASEQMPDGSQKSFELPLFAHVMHLAERWKYDASSHICTKYLSGWPIDLDSQAPWDSVDPTGVEMVLVSGQPSSGILESLLAGFISVLEHMEQSRAFFHYAGSRAAKGVDFNSYCERIGGLNVWRVPLFLDRAPRRFDDLMFLFESGIRNDIANSGFSLTWSEIERPLRRYRDALVKAWESNHMRSMFEEV
jgi:hypothetical protein